MHRAHAPRCRVARRVSAASSKSPRFTRARTAADGPPSAALLSLAHFCRSAAPSREASRGLCRPRLATTTSFSRSRRESRPSQRIFFRSASTDRASRSAAVDVDDAPPPPNPPSSSASPNARIAHRTRNAANSSKSSSSSRFQPPAVRFPSAPSPPAPAPAPAPRARARARARRPADRRLVVRGLERGQHVLASKQPRGQVEILRELQRLGFAHEARRLRRFFFPLVVGRQQIQSLVATRVVLVHDPQRRVAGALLRERASPSAPALVAHLRASEREDGSGRFGRAATTTTRSKRGERI